MLLKEQVPVADADLPVAAFRAHLQLGSGFGEDTAQDEVLRPQLRAALMGIEGKTGKALVTRSFKLVVTAWRNLGRQVLPIAPVSTITSFEITDIMGGLEGIDPSRYRLVQDAHEPVVQGMGFSLPTIPVGGTADFVFDAGFGTWDDVPPDLAQAVMLLATHYYENRSASRVRVEPLPMAVASICRRYMPIRVSGARRI